jgi:hypothetical protein
VPQTLVNRRHSKSGSAVVHSSAINLAPDFKHVVNYPVEQPSSSLAVCTADCRHQKQTDSCTVVACSCLQGG